MEGWTFDSPGARALQAACARSQERTGNAPIVAQEAAIDVCAGCGQTLLTTPDDPMPALWCDTCEGGVK